MARKLVSKPTYAIKLQRGGLIQRYQEGKPIGHVWPIIDSWDPRRWGDPIYDGSFNQAYGNARKNGDDNFWWNGNSYNTEYKHVPAQPTAVDPTADYQTLRYDYIKALENPEMIGYDAKRDRWTRPTQKGYDPNQIGIGLDTIKNKEVAQFLRKNKRNWLTDAEMRQLQNSSFQYFKDVFDRKTQGLKPSNAKRAMAIGLLYHGHGPKLWDRTHALSRALFQGSDQDFINAISKFYGTNTRATRHSQFWKNLYGK